jgi:amidohydrolase family protein
VHDLILTGGHVVDPANNIDGLADVAITDGRVTEVGRASTAAARTIDVAGQYVLPGVIDTHTHLSNHFGSHEGHRMVAETGVVTALDLAGSYDELATTLTTGGAGLNIAFIHPLVPDRTVSDRNPPAAEVEAAVETALTSGALGIKLLGGHYPLTPEATARAMAAAAARRCYLAFHVGTTATGSNIKGLAEALQLAEGRHIHIAHVNSYCRGQITRDPAAEAQQALDLLDSHRNAVSESYLSVYNGTSALCEQGIPVSNVTKTCLRSGGYDETQAGLENAIRAGYARVHDLANGMVVLTSPAEGLKVWRRLRTDAGVSFPVNHIPSAILLATARRGGRFMIEGLSTDGGSIPRNFLVRHGLMLVQMGAWTLRDFTVKASLNPARMMGIPTKGHLSVGADGDVTIVDLETGRATWSVAAGHVVLERGQVTGSGGILLTTDRGGSGLPPAHRRVVHPDGWH